MVDYLIVTFIREEFEAVWRHFRVADGRTVSGVPGATRVVPVTTRGGHDVTAAITRTASEGNVSAQDAVLQLIAEQEPRLVLAVGIAGAVPTSDIFLGDVVLANDIHDLTRGAETATGREEAAASAYLMNAVKDYVANVTMDDFKQWQDRTVAITRPVVTGIGNAWTGDSEWDDTINVVLESNAGRSLPKVVDGVIASSDHLVKSEDFMQRRLLVDRRILANDMESVGVAKACERKTVPVLILRGISDIVGHTRSGDWKHYACEVVASCAREVVSLDAVDAIESRLRRGQPGLSDDTRDVIASLDATLARIRSGAVSESASACRDAFDLFVQLPDELKRRWAPELFVRDTSPRRRRRGTGSSSSWRAPPRAAPRAATSDQPCPGWCKYFAVEVRSAVLHVAAGGTAPGSPTPRRRPKTRCARPSPPPAAPATSSRASGSAHRTRTPVTCAWRSKKAQESVRI